MMVVHECMSVRGDNNDNDDDVVLDLMISCCSRARRRLSCRLRVVSSETIVTSISEWLGLLKCFPTPDFSC